LSETGPIADVRVVQPGDTVTVISAEGMVLSLEVARITLLGRATRGVRLMHLHPGDHVASIAHLGQ
jgi:DNA gyrase/topoisomerase IV subunit A